MIKIIYKKQALSTNEEISSFVNDENIEIALYTFDQTQGKGQYGNSWMSTAKENIAYSLAIPASKINLTDILFNYHTALLIREYIDNLTQEKTQIKWPNDIILNQKKIGGILIEKKKINQTMYYIIGVGINVLQSDYSQLPKAGSIFSLTGQRFDLETVTEGFHDFISERIKEAPQEKIILNEYNRQLFKKNEISVFKKDEISQNGIIKNADEDGFLWIELEKDGLQRFYHKEIELLY